MNITNFDKVRFDCGNSSVFVDVQTIDGHSSNGVMTRSYLIPSFNNKYAKHFVRVIKKGNEVVTFAGVYDDVEIPEYWNDAEVLFEWRQDK